LAALRQTSSPTLKSAVAPFRPPPRGLADRSVSPLKAPESLKSRLSAAAEATISVPHSASIAPPGRTPARPRLDLPRFAEIGRGGQFEMGTDFDSEPDFEVSYGEAAEE